MSSPLLRYPGAIRSGAAATGLAGLTDKVMHFDGYSIAGADASALASWTDEIAGTYTATQGTNPDKPKVGAGELKTGDKVCHCDGSGEHLELGSSYTLSGEFTVIVVCKVLTADSILIGNSTVTRQFRRYRSSANTMSIHDGTSDLFTVTTGMPTIGGNECLVWRRNASDNIVYRANKTNIAGSGSINTSVGIAIDRLGMTNSDNQNLNGYLAEIVVCSSYQSDSQVDSFYDDYATGRWSLP